MILLPPGLAGRFAAVARRCVSGRPTGPPPDLVCRVSGGELSVAARMSNGIALTFTAGTGGVDAVLVLPFDLFPAVAAARGPVEVRGTRGLQGEARWADAAGPRVHPFCLLKPGRPHDPPPAIADRVPCPATLIAALHACGQATARSGGTPRFALDRLCLSGATGRVVGADGKAAVLAGPFPLPFADDRLVPAVPVFGCPEVSAQTAVSVGTADGGVAVTAGPWEVRLPVAPGRYPDVAAVIPKSRPTVGGLDERDARDLLAKLKTLPAGDDPDATITLSLDGGVSVLARAGDRVARHHLPRSPAAGPPVRVALNRAVLARALKLGCLTAKAWAADKPVAFEGGGYTVVAATLGEDDVVPDPTGATGVSVAKRLKADPDSFPITPDRRTAVKPDLPTRPPPETDDPLALAEGLRQALADAHAAAARLVAMLKGRRKEQRALAQVVSSLKSLHLTPGGGGP